MEKELIQILLDALKSARDHLEYCGYGDSWERECAQASGLGNQIKKAVEAGEKFSLDSLAGRGSMDAST
jgi:uncharacterized protein (DUF1684 family)